MDRAKLRAELSRDEGRRLTAYRDSMGLWTIGVGHLLGTSPRMSSITEFECDALLDADIELALDAVRAVFHTTPAWEVDNDVRMRALANMALNRGETNMRKSTTITPAILKAIESGDWKPVTPAILASQWAQEIGDRAKRIALMLETGA
jgi:lysozyme